MNGYGNNEKGKVEGNMLWLSCNYDCFLAGTAYFCVKFGMFYDPRSNTFLNDILIG